MTEQGNGIRWQVQNHEDRIKHLEDLELAVLANRVLNLERRVDSMTRALWTTAGALILASATFALSVASGVIG